MKPILSKILQKSYPFSGTVRKYYSLLKYKYKSYSARRKAASEEYRPGELLFQTNNCKDLRQWIFHDEDWIRVKHRHEHRRIVAADLPLRIDDNWQELTREVVVGEDGTIYFNGEIKTNDEWIYLYLDPEKHHWENYSWTFTVRRETHFRELQFGFRYQDFYNRYRYRFEEDHIYFDKVIKGRFFNAFGAVPFKMELGIWYDVRIDAYENNFRLYVDGNLMLNDYDFENFFPLGPVAVILWEDDGVTDIRAAVGPMSVYRLEV